MPAVNFKQLEERLEYSFKDKKLLMQALTHPSVVKEGELEPYHNQRLEFLGDAVLELALTEDLYHKFPTIEEGPLTKARAMLVNKQALYHQARKLNLGEFLFMGRGEELTGGRHRASSLADAFEAVIGAVFLDGGYGAAYELVTRLFSDEYVEVDLRTKLDNPKGELQELLQSSSDESPRYRIVSASGPEHEREFECVVKHRGKVLGRGKGKSKKLAEAHAALAALQLLNETAPATEPTGETKS